MSTHAEEFRAELAAALGKAFDDAGVVVSGADIAASAAIRDAVATVTADWRVGKGAPKSHDHPLYEWPDKVRFEIHTKPRELNADEVADRERSMARWEWKRGVDDFKSEPPKGITRLDLLGQKVWWITKEDVRVKLVDMNPGHRANTLALLERQAEQMHLVYAGSGVFMNAPDDVQASLENEDPRKWLSKQPLIKRLRRMVKADRVLAGDEA